jgi:Immunoglobulin domain
MVSATCTVNKGDLPLEVSWIHMDTSGIEHRLVTNDGVVITRTNQRISMLSIEAVKARHRGNYSCIAKNKAGIVQHSAYLAMNGSNFQVIQVPYQNFHFKEFCNLFGRN